jgi:hypothetical protein
MFMPVSFPVVVDVCACVTLPVALTKTAAPAPESTLLRGIIDFVQLSAGS